MVLHSADYDLSPWTSTELFSFLAAPDRAENRRRVCVLRRDPAAPRGLIAGMGNAGQREQSGILPVYAWRCRRPAAPRALLIPCAKRHPSFSSSRPSWLPSPCPS
jgi:hypothetical protein